MKKHFLSLLPIAVGLILPAFNAGADTVYVVDGATIKKIDTNGVSSVFAIPSLSGPAGVAYDSAGNLYVANSGNNTIEKFTTNGSSSVFASDPGDGSVLSSPVGLAFNSEGTLYAANSGNNSIEEFDTNGVGTLFAADPGDLSVLDNPQGLAFDHAGLLYVVNQGNNTIEKLDTIGNGTTFATDPGNGSVLSNPRALAIDSKGNLYVGNDGNNTIEKFATNGVDSVFATNGLNNPAGLVFDPADTLYVVNGGTGLTIGNNTIERFTTNGVGSVIYSLLYSPVTVSLNSSGNLMVVDSVLGIEQFNTNGTYLGLFASPSLSIPDGAAFDTKGNLYVANYLIGTIEKFDTNGGGSTFVPTGFLGGPVGLAFDGAGNLYAANSSGNRISKIDTNGVVSTFATDPGDRSVLNNPGGLAIDGANNVFAVNRNVDTNNNAIEKFTPAAVGSMFAVTGGNPSFGTYIAFDKTGSLYAINQFFGDEIDKFAPNGSHSIFVAGGGTNLNNPQSIGFDSAGNLYVANQGNGTIEKYDTNGAASVFTSGLFSPTVIAIWPGISPSGSAARPTLTIARSGTNAIISWPLAAANFGLQSTPTLSSPSWTPVTNVPGTNGGNFVVTNGIAGAAKFYRLQGN